MNKQDANALTRRQGLIFDLDGTLWDSIDTVVEAWNQGFRLMNREQRISRETLRPMMGKTVEAFRLAYFSDLSEEEGMKGIETLFAIENELVQRIGGKLYPQVTETLARLAEHYPLFIVSNCGKGYIEAFLAHYELEKLFTDIESNGGTGLSKAENIRLIMKRNGLEQAYYIGDTKGDCDAAAKAEVPFIFASYGFGEAQPAVFTLGKFEELSELPLFNYEH